MTSQQTQFLLTGYGGRPDFRAFSPHDEIDYHSR